MFIDSKGRDHGLLGSIILTVERTGPMRAYTDSTGNEQGQ